MLLQIGSAYSMKKILCVSLILCLGLVSKTYSQTFYPNKYLQELDEAYASGMFRGWNANFLVPMDDPAAPAFLNVFQYLQGRIPGLMITGAGSNLRKPYISYRSGTPVLYLDEMRVDSRLLASIPMSDIAFIKVFRTPFSGAVAAGNGAIAVYTRDGDEE